MADGNGNCPPNEEDTGVSMVDVLEEEEQLEADANAVLGDSDDKNCTYESGYVPRQAVYACATCTPAVPEGSQPAGICLACSYECHEGHSLWELYTKRNFRCDCGNSRFPDFTCKLFPNKESVNPGNTYNQNFRGVYCTCSRPYPDVEDSVEDEMIQCVICEDWYHGRHLGTSLPQNQDFMEMICDGCMKKCDFLWPYAVHSVEVTQIEKADTSVGVDVETVQAGSTDADTIGTKSEYHKTDATGSGSQTAERKESENQTVEALKPLSQEHTNVEAKIEQKNGQCSANLSESSSPSCKLQELQQRDIPRTASGATYWPNGWRAKLCLCNDCTKLYEEKQVPFLPDEGDTVHAYEERGRGKEPGQSQYDRGLNVLSSMGRIQQVEVLRGYNDMKEELTDYLKKFADNGKVVREEDIREFFTELQKKKRQRVEGPPQFHCK
ncbi:putative E3 ubiquitin-protein ligase UBR7 [Lingula anatina]|uniref:Putative E3 ubiquitin-protein ligase UBR7 n=1 Tax=Lingula anatina TaxID=7574 RepID=A0A1S3I141_LINAN|nr:putative E3 ubiquitin-protein ligase UBR7 [Lingula anatina]|eukprot:XP_013391546.1 putative E3 ubiquitin-protein ligase UBR7 [Lingula anatina]